MKTNTSTLNPNAVSYVPLAKREVEDVDKDGKSFPLEASFDDLKLKDHQKIDAAYDSQPVFSQDMYSNFMDEETEMDLDYLQMMFPGVSNQFLADVYNVTQGDFEAAVDMISELESTGDQPDSLNNDKAAEPVSSGECLPAKVTSVIKESSTSSGSSGVTVDTS